MLPSINKDNLTLVTTCKGRLHHLKQTLPHMIALNASAVIVVDANCPDGTGSWVEQNWPQAMVVRDRAPGYFNLSHSRNIGAANARTDWIFFIDADIMLRENFSSWIADTKKDPEPSFYIAGDVNGLRDVNSWGSVIVPRKAFELAHGYDSEFRGWGGEDDDLYWKLERLGLCRKTYPGDSVNAIQHTDQERTKFNRIKNKGLQLHINATYAKLKRTLLSLQDHSRVELPENVRAALMDQAELSHEAPYKGHVSLCMPSIKISKMTNIEMNIILDFKINLNKDE
jgi:hypothetical protein